MLLLAGLLGVSVDAQLLHRYDFETAGGANDTVGTANGMIYGTATVSGGALSLGGELRVGGSDQDGTAINAAGNVTQTGGNVYVSALTLARGNNNQNNCSGTLNVNGGTFVSTNDVLLAWGGTGTGKMVINGGTFIIGSTATKWFMLGAWDTTASELGITNGNLYLENNSCLKLSRFTTTSPSVANQAGGSVTFYSNAGTTVGGSGNLDLNTGGNASSSATYNLNGGILIVPQITNTVASGTRVFNFNGGTLKAAGNSASFMASGVASAANVRNGGAIMDTAGFNVTIGQALQHSAIVGDNAADGGLTKNGNGTLTMTGANTYSGNTTINAGTLKLAQSVSTLATNSTVSVASGAALQLDNSAVTNMVASPVTNGLAAGNGLYGSANSSGFITGPGYLRVFAGSVGPRGPAYLTNSINGFTLSLTWPAVQGWRLQVATNLASPNWVYLTEGFISSTNITIDPTTPAAFYRLAYP